MSTFFSPPRFGIHFRCTPILTLGHRHCWSFQYLSTKSSLEAFKQMTSRLPSLRNKYLTAKVSYAVLDQCNPSGLLQRSADARLKRASCNAIWRCQTSPVQSAIAGFVPALQAVQVSRKHTRLYFSDSSGKKRAEGDVLLKTTVRFSRMIVPVTRSTVKHTGTAWRWGQNYLVEGRKSANNFRQQRHKDGIKPTHKWQRYSVE